MLAILNLYQWIVSKIPSFSDYTTRLAKSIHDLRDKMIPTRLENGHHMPAQEEEVDRNESVVSEQD